MTCLSKGYTLIELVITMLIFVIVIILTGTAFNRVTSYSSKLMKSEESNIEGVIGLEVLRRDLEQIGFGLAQSFSTPISYTEAGSSPANSASLNDAPGGVPRAVATIDHLNVTGLIDSSPAAGSGSSSFTIMNSTDYLTLKGVSLGTSVSRNWTYMNYTSIKNPPHKWNADNIPDTTKVIMLRNSYSDSSVTNQLVAKSSSDYSVAYDSTGFNDTAYRPSRLQDIFYIYGVNDTTLGMPFNRVDYMVATPATASLKPTICAPKTGILYRATVNHSDGKLFYTPILDCVADMQVVFGWDMDSDTYGAVDTYSNADGTTVSGFGTVASVSATLSDPAQIRQRLKTVKVYVLVQDGKLDPTYTSNSTIVVGNTDPNIPDTASLTKTYTFTSDMLNYHWKVYRVIAQ